MRKKMDNCIFCKIINNQLPAEFIYQDDLIAIFKDINPQAKTHLLLVPKLHIKSLADLTIEHQEIINHAMYKIPEIAKQIGLSGFRTIINTGRDGGQVVDHLHFHILSPKL
jgi:histidine triad (HIT) family protein